MQIAHNNKTFKMMFKKQCYFVLNYTVVSKMDEEKRQTDSIGFLLQTFQKMNESLHV